MTASLNGLLSWVQATPRISRDTGKTSSRKAASGLCDMSRARSAIIAALISDIDHPVLIMTPTAEESQRTDRSVAALDAPDPARLMQLPGTPSYFFTSACPGRRKSSQIGSMLYHNLYMHRIGKGDPNDKTHYRQLQQSPDAAHPPYRQFHRAARHHCCRFTQRLSQNSPGMPLGSDTKLSALCKHPGNSAVVGVFSISTHPNPCTPTVWNFLVT